MTYNFDRVIDRKNTDSIKYDKLNVMLNTNAKDVLPMWVADMDFAVPETVNNAIKKRVEHPIYGYSFKNEMYFDAVINWVNSRHNWQIKKEWILFSPGIVTAINLAIMAYTNVADEIIIQTPVYFPFFKSIHNNNRKVVNNQLINENGYYKINFKEFEKQAKSAKMFLMSSPHNPVGRVWTKDELTKIAEICQQNNVLIVSDEIHNDLIFPDVIHYPIASLSKKYSDNVVSFISPSKTFNLAGFGTSSVVIENKELKEKFEKKLQEIHLIHGNIFGTLASTVAYTTGAEWLDALMKYIHNNYLYVKERLKNEFPMLKLTKSEGTFLVWIDFSALNLDDLTLKTKLMEEAKLGFSPGIAFGSGGEGFMRMNIATPRSIIDEMFKRLSILFG